MKMGKGVIILGSAQDPALARLSWLYSYFIQADTHLGKLIISAAVDFVRIVKHSRQSHLKPIASWKLSQV